MLGAAYMESINISELENAIELKMFNYNNNVYKIEKINYTTNTRINISEVIINESYRHP